MYSDGRDAVVLGGNMKKLLVVLIIAVLAVSMVFAGGSGEKASAAKKVRAALITNPKGISPYINDGIDGFERACAKWGIEGTVVECKGSAEYEENTRAAANEGYDLILAGSWEAGSIVKELADVYKDIKFGIIDTLVDSQDVKCIQYFEGEGAYLVGVIAALAVDGETHNYGCVNVSKGPGSWKWRYGYAQGVLSVDPEAKFIFNYVYGYSEVNLAYEVALQQYELGCKFINGAAAGGDAGVFQAAKEKGFYSSGQDIDETSADNPFIITSQLKGAGVSIEYMVDQFMSGKWTTENEYLGIKEGAIGAIWATEDSKISKRNPALSDADIAHVKQVVEDIKSGKINMRNLPDEDTVNLPLISR